MQEGQILVQKFIKALTTHFGLSHDVFDGGLSSNSVEPACQMRPFLLHSSGLTALQDAQHCSHLGGRRGWPG